MCPSAHLCAYNNLKTIEWMCNKFDFGKLFEKVVRTLGFSCEVDNF
jgi:hypothetical protein